MKITQTPFLLTTIILATILIMSVSSADNVYAAAKINLEQCHNGPAGTPLNCIEISANENYWGTGNANAGNAHVSEGDSQNYRIIMTGLANPSDFILVIEQDLTKGGKMAQDFWTDTGFLDTLDGYGANIGIYQCSEKTSPTKYCNPQDIGAAFSIPPIPTGIITGDTTNLVPTAQTNFGSQSMRIIGGSASFDVTPYTFTGDFTGDSSIQGKIHIHSTSSTVVIAYAGHISKTADYAPDKITATGITGSPYHNRLKTFDGVNGDPGNQDMQMASAAIVLPATLTVNKVCDPTNDLGKFNLRIDGSTAGTGANAACGTGTTGAVVVTAASHTVSETAGTSTDLNNYTSVISGDCAANGTVTLAAGDNKVCTITNTHKTTLTVNKVCDPTNDPGKFNLRIDGSTAGTGANAACGTGTTGAVVVTAASHTVSETQGTSTLLSNYTPVIGGDCAADGTVTLAAGDNKVCTITNTHIATFTVN